MMKKYLILSLIFLFSISFAEEVCQTTTIYRGCSISDSEAWDCAGNMITRVCEEDEPICNGQCKEFGSTSISTSECSNDDLFVQILSTYEEYHYSLPDAYTLSAITNYYQDTCAYGYIFEVTAEVVCTGHTFVFWCNEWYTIGSYKCRDVVCADDWEYSTKTCERTANTQEDCHTEEEGSCDEDGQFCKDNKVTECTYTGAYWSQNDCDIENRECVETSSTTAICINRDAEEELLNCTPEGSKRCNPADLNWVQTCSNNQWQNSFQCTMSCNSTGLASTSTQCVTLNVEEGGCTNGQTFCHDAGSYCYYFLCTNTDWLLLYKCDTPRCNENATGCYEGCSLYDSYYYEENNTGYYCNIEGDWELQGECMGIVNPITNQCELPDKCVTGSVTCSQGWKTECKNEEWSYIEQCSFGCALGQCKEEGADIFERISYSADYLVAILPNVSIFMSMLLVASTLGYLLKSLFTKAGIWIQGKEE